MARNGRRNLISLFVLGICEGVVSFDEGVEVFGAVVQFGHDALIFFGDFIKFFDGPASFCDRLLEVFVLHALILRHGRPRP